ncbi:APC family permease [Nakamurella multipartita]|jgi:amino acid transporter|uniref:Amino acid permease-associated region n=1 Tax=Nakamurella multipartita (strain ATCC 700099 / DSM 44233 / CIP 104796 / JCM 9543 / NBRC 105858 / Y-104) TaxID=479431 RepID=C8X9F6_NAKMY|nr:APC family permease [Nakamurella multipartita]ACV77224.1 amino acid permease-associated region [Nakamurella multipartita DSM 44233]
MSTDGSEQVSAQGHHHPQQEKGLASGSVGLLGGTILGISSVAPAYTLTATIGLVAAVAGVKIPIIFIAGFIPMFFAAYAYREFNRVDPDCGTSFTWTTRAFGPYVGWLGGWVAILATIIVLANLAAIGVQFFYQLLGSIFNNPDLGDLWTNKLVNVGTCLAFLAMATAVAYRGITTTEKVQFVLVFFQLAVLLLFAVMAFTQAGGPDDPDGLAFSWDWFNPFTGLTLSAFVAGLGASIFSFWGWDTALTVNEESKDSDKTPGRAALLCVVSILLTYLLVSISALMYAGDGTEGLGLGNEEISDNVFGALAEPVMGSPWSNLLFLAVLASSAASLMTTFLPTTRTMLGMATYRALPARFASIHPRFKTPGFNTIVAGCIAGAFYTALYLVSEAVLTDTILSLGLMICFYYGLTAIGCVWFFRAELFTSFNNVIFKFLLPLVGGLGLWFVFFVTLKDSADPDYDGTGVSIFGLGVVFVLGLGMILLGVVVMLIMRARQPAFFQGKTLNRNTQTLIIPE